MKNFKSSITIIATFLIVVGIIVSSFVTQYSALISTVTTTITAVIGAVALFFQFKKDKDINKASFLLEFSKQFYETYDCKTLFNIIESDVDDSAVDLETILSSPDMMPHIENYLSWCKTLAALVNDEVISLKDINQLFYYRFFAVVNNKTIQDIELIKYHVDYSDIINLYVTWHKYRKQHNQNIPFEESDLCIHPQFKNVVENLKIGKK